MNIGSDCFAFIVTISLLSLICLFKILTIIKGRQIAVYFSFFLL